MSIYSLYQKRGKFGIKEHVEVFIISTRWFACVWTFLTTLFGVLLARYNGAEINWHYTGYAILVIQALLLAGHFINNFRDYERGVDRDIDISKVKPYTAASALVPLGITSTRYHKFWAVAFTLLSLVALYPLLSLPWWTQIVAFYILGIILSFGYTDIFKPRGLGELAIFLGQGIGSEAFGFLSVAPLTAANWWKVTVAMIPIAFAGAFFYSIDQYQDAKSDFTKRVRNFAIILWQSEIPLGVYMILGYTFVLFVTHMAVTLGVLPGVTLALVLPTWVLVLLVAAYYHINPEKAIKYAVFSFVYLFPLAMDLSLLLA